MNCNFCFHILWALKYRVKPENFWKNLCRKKLKITHQDKNTKVKKKWSPLADFNEVLQIYGSHIESYRGTSEVRQYWVWKILCCQTIEYWIKWIERKYNYQGTLLVCGWLGLILSSIYGSPKTDAWVIPENKYRSKPFKSLDMSPPKVIN